MIPNTVMTKFHGMEDGNPVNGARCTGGRDGPRSLARRLGGAGTGTCALAEGSLRSGRF